MDSNLNESLRMKSNVETYKMLLKSNITQVNSEKVLAYSRKEKMRGEFILDSWEGEVEGVRKINKQPYKILDAPKLKDDYYNNLLDWSKDDLIAIALGNVAYVWSGKSN
jgi:cell division cycle 20-like protein 1 (cofactor of APC complex)